MTHQGPPKLDPRDIRGDDPWEVEAERKDLDREIDAIMRDQHDGFGTDAATQARLTRMQAQYLELVSGANGSLKPIDLMDWATEYFARPDVQLQHPSLMDISDGLPHIAAYHIVGLMCLAKERGHELSIGDASAIAEEAFAQYTTLSGDDRLAEPKAARQGRRRP